MLSSFLCKGIQVLKVANAALLDDLGDALSALADLAIRVAVVDSENATVQACPHVCKEWHWQLATQERTLRHDVAVCLSRPDSSQICTHQLVRLVWMRGVTCSSECLIIVYFPLPFWLKFKVISF